MKDNVEKGLKELENYEEKDLSIVDFTQLLKAVGGDREHIKELAQCFLEEYPTQQKNIELAVKSKDALLLKKHCHKLKGTLQLIRARNSYNLICELEKLSISSELNNALQVYEKLHEELKKLACVLRNMN
ncbi:Hpt domain-containing protein [Clostridium magnum]|uniref:HPt domain-containing protein n=1 Tax=Clostridium magnum DSM 2767 TaxID=1121326 RepID=A0A161WYZ0_9CLOT|nr:Hpt domain-containing protein [Clostridium magnum]KZL92338.1 hypothetical protein CLMAG_21470 [Clostridium magnum DSM 2767]SHH12905.1 HPt (histidine-containing phosphotransfer) domain-containing protein [Clostridium magnum DSM 2767]